MAEVVLGVEASGMAPVEGSVTETIEEVGLSPQEAIKIFRMVINKHNNKVNSSHNKAINNKAFSRVVVISIMLVVEGMTMGFRMVRRT